MKTFLKWFAEIKFIRKYIGGTWYLVYAPEMQGGLTGPPEFWTQKKPINDEEIIKMEKY
jgi:hypothetical protein